MIDTIILDEWAGIPTVELEPDTESPPIKMNLHESFTVSAKLTPEGKRNAETLFRNAKIVNQVSRVLALQFDLKKRI